MALERKVLRGPQFSRVAAPVQKNQAAQALLSSLEDLSKGLRDFRNFEKARQVQNDIITAKTAYALEQEMPGGLSPEAEATYDILTAKKSARQFLTNFKLKQEVFAPQILQDPSLDPIQRQKTHDDLVRKAYKHFIGSAGFTDLQAQAVTEMLDKEALVMAQDFTTLNAKDIAARRQTGISEYVRTTVDHMVDVMDKSGAFASQMFHPEFHSNLEKELIAANPGATRDEVQAMILDQLEIVAADPDNPRPELLDFYDVPDSKGHRLTSRSFLRPRIEAAQSRARTLFNAHRTAEAKAEKEKIANDRLNQHISAAEHITKMFANAAEVEPISDIVQMRGLIEEQYPLLKPSQVNTLLEGWQKMWDSPHSSANTSSETGMFESQIQEGAFISETDLMADPRFINGTKAEKSRFRKSYLQYRRGAFNEADELRKSLLNQYEHAVINAFKTNREFTLGKDYTVDNLTGKITLSGPAQVEANNLIGHFYNELGGVIDKINAADVPGGLLPAMQAATNQAIQDILRSEAERAGSAIPQFNVTNAPPNVDQITHAEAVRRGAVSPTKALGSSVEPKAAGLEPVETPAKGSETIKATKAGLKTETVAEISSRNVHDLAEQPDPAEHPHGKEKNFNLITEIVESLRGFQKLAQAGAKAVGEAFSGPAKAIGTAASPAAKAVGEVAKPVAGAVGSAIVEPRRTAEQAPAKVTFKDSLDGDNARKAVEPFITKDDDTETAQLASDEGFRAEAYEDTSEKKHPTIGFGFRLDRPDSDADLKAAGINIPAKDFIAKKAKLTPEQALKLFRVAIKSARRRASKFPGFAKLNPERQSVLVNMHYQLGTMVKWKETKKFMEIAVRTNKPEDWANVAAEMLRSKWATQTPDRAKRLSKRMKNG